MFTPYCSSNTVLQPVFHPALGDTGGAAAALAGQAEPTLYLGKHNQGGRAKHAENTCVLPWLSDRGKRPFLKNKGTRMDNKLLQRLFPLEEVTFFHLSEQYLHINSPVFLCA